MNHDSMIAVIEAHKKDWRSVEFRRKDSNNAWVTPAMNTHFNFFDFEYRIVPHFQAGQSTAPRWLQRD